MLRYRNRLLKNASDFQSTRSARLPRQPFVTQSAATRAPSYAVWCAIACAFIGLSAPAAPADVDGLLKNVEARYNRAESLKLDFTESYAGIKSPVQNDSGVLFLRKPGRMRWEYSSPAGKVFISDGKEVVLYDPDQQRAEKSKLKESEDMRAPLAFLLGKLDFKKEFKSFQSRVEGEDNWIVAEPKSIERLPNEP